MSNSRLSGTASTIEECETIRHILKYCSYNSALVFDLDNTIFRPTREEDLGSDQWFQKALQRAMQIFPQRPQALKSAVTINDNLQKHIKVKPVEPHTQRIVQMLNDLGLLTIAVTARSAGLAETTLKQLHDIDVRFTKDATAHDPVEFYVQGRKVYYVNNVMFCDGANKGACFAELIKRKLISCGGVVMLDDVKKNLVDMMEAVHPLGKDFYGLRYNHLDQRVTQFDFKRANVKLSSVSLFFSQSVVQILDELELEGYSAEAKLPEAAKKKPL
jgi:hypothetical protein